MGFPIVTTTVPPMDSGESLRVSRMLLPPLSLWRALQNGKPYRTGNFGKQSVLDTSLIYFERH